MGESGEPEQALLEPVNAIDSKSTKPDSPSPLDHTIDLPVPDFAKARLDKRKRKLPQCIAHRGFKAKYPENTLLAFEQAVKAGTHAIETDVRLSKDDVIVISHDATLKRCYGRKDKINTVPWDELKDLRTIKAPHVPMPSLQDVLKYLAKPGLEDVWLLLDIKPQDDPDNMMRLIGSTIAGVPPSARPWNRRIVLGCWVATYLPLATKYLPGFPVVHIGFALTSARPFFKVPNVGFNMLTHILMGPGGRRFIRDCQETHHRTLIAWTVNETDKMEWCIRRKLDGVITDDPTMFLEVCEKYDEYSPEPWFPMGAKSYLDVMRIWVLATVMYWFITWRMKPKAKKMPAQQISK